MCCLFTTLVLLGPRFGILVWWIIQPARWNLAFETFFWPFMGFLFFALDNVNVRGCFYRWYYLV